ncbi:MAG: hypothetical protein MZU97_09865 [Bacillus subtilis]|nr:hypothetical protein [Bacillus subtilis]
MYATLGVFIHLDETRATDVGSNYELLPESEEVFIDISTSGLVNQETNTHYFIMQQGSSMYRFYASLPLNVVIDDLRYWTIGYTTSNCRGANPLCHAERRKRIEIAAYHPLTRVEPILWHCFEELRCAQSDDDAVLEASIRSL